MAHEIQGERFYARSRPGWHNLGTVFPEDMKVTASDAVRHVAGDIKVNPYPLYYLVDPGYGAAPVYERAGDHNAIIREPVHDDPSRALLGITTERWHQMTYLQLAEALDELSRSYKVETAGLLLKGALCFVSFRGPDFDVKGDQMKDYFLANLSQEPGKAHSFNATPVRTVCWNTNQIALKEATIALRIPHSQNAQARIELAATLVSRFKEITSKNRDVFEQFAGRQITETELLEVFRAAWPDPTKPTELRLLDQALGSAEQGMIREAFGRNWGAIVKAQETFAVNQERVNRIRLAGRESFESFKPEHLRGTVWSAYNAVTEIADWREGRNADFAGVFGSRAGEKTRAFTACAKLLK